MQNMKIIGTVLICSILIASIESRPSFPVNKLKGVVDLDNKHDIKNLIGVLKNYLHTKKSEDSTEESGNENGTETIVEDERSALRAEDSEETFDRTRQIPENNLIIQEANMGTTTNDVRVLKYKVTYYTMDHPVSEVRRWMRKGFEAWSNPRIDAYLRKYGCPTLDFVETTSDDYDFAVNFDYAFFARYDSILSWYWEKDSTIYINDHKDLRRDWIAHAIAYDTCDMLGCQCTRHPGQNEIMDCGPLPDWNIYKPTQHDFRTMAAALGCRAPREW